MVSAPQVTCCRPLEGPGNSFCIICVRIKVRYNMIQTTTGKYVQNQLSSVVINLKTSKNTYLIVSSSSFVDDKPSPQPEKNASVYIYI